MVYFIVNERSGAIKIGHASNPLKRLYELQTGCPDELMLMGQISGGREASQAVLASDWPIVCRCWC